MNTTTGAFIAVAIAFITGFLALMSQDGVNGIADISEKAWWILGGGGALTFMKDYQAIATRRVINRVTGTGDGGGSGPLMPLLKDPEDPKDP